MPMTPCVGRIMYGNVVNPAQTAWYSPSNVCVKLPESSSIKLTINPKVPEREHFQIDNEFILEYEGIIYLESNYNGNIEEACNTIKSVLSQNQRTLYIPEIGIGFTGTVVPKTPGERCGPYVQECIVSPYCGNQAISIKWTVTFYQDQAYSLGELASGPVIKSLSKQISLDIDDEGDLAINVEVEVRTVEPVIKHKSALLEKFLIFQSPLPTQYHLNAKRVIEKDAFTLSVVITYSPIKSENAYYPYIHDIDVTHEVQSSLMSEDDFSGAGFRTWLNILSGTITLKPGMPKIYAFYIFQLIVRNRLMRLELFKNLNVAGDSASSGTTDALDPKNSKYIPLTIRLKESIYSRTVDFTFEWLVTSDLPTLLYATGLFNRINTFRGTYLSDKPLTDPGQNILIGEELGTAPLNLEYQYDLYNRVPHDQTTRASIVTQLFDTGYPSYTLPDKYFDLPKRYVEETEQDHSPLSLNNPKGFRLNEVSSRIKYDQKLPNQADLAWLAPPPGTITEPGVIPDGSPAMYKAFLPSSTSKPNIFNSHKPVQLDPERSWVLFEPKYEIIEDTNALPVDYLEDVGTSYVAVSQGNTNGLNPHRDQFNISPTTQSSSNDPEIIARTYARKYVRFTGRALRVNYRIPMPVITTIAGKQAYRVGQTRWKEIPIAQSGTHNVYLAMWDIIYTVDNNGNWNNIFDPNSLVQHITPQQVV